MSDAPPVAPPASDPTVTVAPVAPARIRRGISIRSILLIMLLTVSIVSTVVVGIIGYANGSDSLRTEAIDKLVQVRDSRSSEVHTLFSSIESSLVLSAHGDSVIGATKAFSTAYAGLGTAVLTPAQTSGLSDYYTKTFAPKLALATGAQVDASTFVPNTQAAKYLQARYTAKVPDDTKGPVNPSGAAWATANDKYSSYFSSETSLDGFGDTLIIDSSGNVVYSAKKGVDLGTSLVTGPYRQSELATAWSTAMTGNLPDSVTLSDFERFPPALNAPTGWAVAPVASGGSIIGAIAVELPLARINDVMTGAGNATLQGLGKTGETYLVGDDQLLRSASRELIENPKLYSRDAKSAGLAPAQIARVLATRNPVLVQPARTQAVAKALQGKTGTTISPGYLGGETISAYAPLALDGVNWVIVAQIDRDEAYAPSADFAKTLGLTVAVIALLVCLLSLLLAQIIVVPLRRLRDDARRLAAGELGVQVDAGRSEEFAELGAAFNDMSTSLQQKQELLQAKEEQHEKLLLSLMPEPVARKYLEGAETIAQDHREVTVMFADIAGFEEYAKTLDAEKGLGQLNDLVHSFDQAADEHGVERVRTTRQGYLASCGMTIPRVDNARRMVAFALEMQKILDRFSAQYGAKLVLRAGLDTGTATSGLVGKSRVIYDLWGDTVNLAFELQGDSDVVGIMLTQRVLDRMPDTVVTVPAGTLDTVQGKVAIARLDVEKTSRV